MRGMVNTPVAYTLAGAEPEMEPNSAEAKMATLAGPPFDFLVSRQERSMNTLFMLEVSRKAPNMQKAKIMVQAVESEMP